MRNPRKIFYAKIACLDGDCPGSSNASGYALPICVGLAKCRAAQPGFPAPPARGSGGVFPILCRLEHALGGFLWVQPCNWPLMVFGIVTNAARGPDLSNPPHFGNIVLPNFLEWCRGGWASEGKRPDRPNGGPPHIGRNSFADKGLWLLLRL